ncbi:MAG TPA: MFS transporter [Anaeromyxobacteraceae bacterium]|jgi:EmrB/QacA subfamily drug resistance transporter|nr:MFS transporter [Anaeromyxobacteraceae bacterium]
MDDARPARSPWIGFSAVAVGTVMSTLDGSIVNVALPTMRRELSASIGGVQWIIAAYLLTISATLLTAGRLGDLFGHRRVFVGGVLLFTTGSALCGLAPALPALVAARVVQALGAAATMAIGPAVLTSLFPPSQRGRALGANASVVALGLTLGPPIGGFIVQHLSWRWLFLVNLPVGLGGALWSRVTLPAAPADPGARFDRQGALLIALAVSAAVAGVQAAPTAPTRAAALALLAVVGGALLVRRERRDPSPLVDAALFRSRLFSAGLASGLLSYAALFSSTLLTPFYLAQVKGLGARDLGLMLTAVPVALSLASSISGRLSDRIGSRALCLSGMALVAAGQAGLSLAGRDTGLGSVAARLAACGFGMGLFQPPNNSDVMGTLPRARLGTGGGLLAEARNLGMVLGISLSQALFHAFGGEASGDAAFLRGYRAALLAGAGVALSAGLVSLVRGARPPAPEAAASGRAAAPPS